MIEKIGIFLNEQGETATFKEPGIINVYKLVEGEWKVETQLPLNLSIQRTTIGVRQELDHLARAIPDCRILVAKEIGGLAYGILDGLMFHIWEMEDTIEDILSYVYIKEREEELQLEQINCDELKESIVKVPVETSEKGCYEFDLKAIQKENSGVTSKQVLKPFLHKNLFYQLTLYCTHVPNWLEEDMRKLNLSGEVKQLDPHTYQVRIRKNSCSE